MQQSEAWRAAVVKHGMTGGPEYRVWAGMKRRCLNPKNDRYADYGGRGIRVCDKWLSFEGFFEDMGPRPAGAQLDRRDNDGDYCKENCRWATRVEQQNNMRSNRRVVVGGEVKTLAEVARETGLPEGRLRTRIQRGWSVERALTSGTGKATATHCLNGHEYTIENTALVTRGDRVYRNCVTCRRAAGREFMRKRRSAKKAQRQVLSTAQLSDRKAAEDGE